MKDQPSLPPYAAAVLRMFAEGQTKPGINHVVVQHDDWCAIFCGGRCNCNPDVELVPEPKGPMQ